MDHHFTGAAVAYAGGRMIGVLITISLIGIVVCVVAIIRGEE
jgi:uncharacterized membrane protein